MNKIIMTDGTRHETIFKVKSINPWADDMPGVWSPDPTDAAKQAKSTRLVPSVFAGIAARVQAMADLPFTIYTVNGDTPKDDSDNYKNVLGFLPHPTRFFGLTEASLVTNGRAYWFKAAGSTTGKVKELQYWMPTSVTLDAESLKKRIIKFKRQGVNDLFNAEQVQYFWLDDESVELGPPTIWPLLSACLAAEASGAISKWVRDYMLRGAIKAMLLAVDGVPPPGEIERMETWWNKFMTGVRALQWKVFNMQNVKPTIVGDGLEALKDLSVKKDLRYEIHEALGTRHLLEDENYATAQARERQFYTQAVVPDARLIQHHFNDQTLHALGYHLEFEPERLEIFQTDEAERSKSLADLFGVFSQSLGAPQALTLAMDILGYDVSKDQQRMIDEGLAQKEKDKQVAAEAQAEQSAALAQQQSNQPPMNKALVELDRWQRKVEKAGKMVTWHAVDIPADLAKAITEGLSFDEARARLQDSTPDERQTEIKRLADQLNKLVEMSLMPVKETVTPSFTVNAPITLTTQMPAQGEPSITFAPEFKPETQITVQPAENVNQITVQPTPVEFKPENKITVKPADVNIPKPIRELQKVNRHKRGDEKGLIDTTDTQIQYEE